MTSDPSLHDEQLENEIQLVGELVLAASQSPGRLPQDVIDDILGVGRHPGPAGRLPSGAPGPADEVPGPVTTGEG